MGPLLSQSWYRVAELRPQLRSHAKLHRHLYRGEVWYLLQDPASGRIHRFPPGARLVIAAMDGKRSVQGLWELANRHLGEEAPTQDDIISLLGQLHASDLLLTDVSPDVAELFDRGEKQEKTKRQRSYSNPMALRIPLWDPNEFLNRIRPVVDFVWSRWGAALWLAAVLPALILLPQQWNELTHNFSDRLMAVNNLLLLWLLFPVIKALHEFGHASAAKAGGGEVHDLGIMFLVLMPVPYVEASSANVFPSKFKRALVGAGGMLAELLVAALAFYVWLLAEPGVVRAIMFNVMIVAGVSTLLFNGNPLLRYDAYYILADLIEMPNLAPRSQRYWAYLLDRYLLGAADAESPPGTRSEKAWMFFYGAASSVYRVLVTVAIALFVAAHFFFIGVLLAIWALVGMAGIPLFKGLRHVFSSPRLRRNRARAVTVTVGGLCALLVFLVVVPMPHRTRAEGVVWLPERALVRVQANCFFEKFLAEPESLVRAGQPLFQCRNPMQESDLRVRAGRVEELEKIYASEFVVDRAKADLTREKLEAERAALSLARERAAEMIVLAGADGMFKVPLPGDLPGRFLRKGQLVGHLTDNAPPLARVVVDQGAADLVQLSIERVDVRLAQQPDHSVEGRVVRHVPAAGERLPSTALAVAGGGSIVVDPRDGSGSKTLEKMFQLDIELPSITGDGYFGQRVHVRFAHHMEPLSTQWYRSLRQLFLARFNV